MSNSKRFPTIGQTVPTLKAILPEPPMGESPPLENSAVSCIFTGPSAPPPGLFGRRTLYLPRAATAICGCSYSGPSLAETKLFFDYPVFPFHILHLLPTLNGNSSSCNLHTPAFKNESSATLDAQTRSVIAPLGPLELGPTRLQRIRNPSDSSPVSSRKPSLSNSDNYSTI